MINHNELLTTHELATMLRVSKKTVFELIVRDRLPCRKVGREYRFVRQAIVDWLLVSQQFKSAHGRP